MAGAVLVAIAASIGNLLQGWDNATIAGAVLYIKKEFNLQSEPLIEGLIVAMSLIGATIITTFSGAVADSFGRRPMLIASAVLYFVSGLVMLWAPNVYVLLLARLIDGFGIGLAVTLVPLYISETAPTDIRGLLNTLPQFSGSGGMFLSYCMVFGMSLMPQPDWRIMLGVLSIPSLIYFALTIFYLPESPRWLVSKGRMAEAKRVLQGLRGREDVSGEMALLVEGLGVGKDTKIEEYIIGPDDELADEGLAPDPEKIKLYGPEEGLSWVARPVHGQSALGSALGLISRHGSMVSQGKPLVDPVVTLFGSVHEKMPEIMGSMRSTLFPNFGSMFSVAEQQQAKGDWDAESQREGEDYGSDHGGDDIEDSLQSPLISRQATSVEGKEIAAPHGSIMGAVGRSSSLMQGGEAVSSMGIGGGWQFLLLATIPILIVALAILILVNILDVGTMVHASLSTVSVILYFCFFVMGFGPIPNILCAEIFPTTVRGICIAICALTFWIGDIIVTYTLPVMLNAIGLAGVFGIYAVVCVLAFLFVFMKVPETKGMPLEVITEFFSVGAKQSKED
uniref:Major facilitator superfamily (MFS) profile domain-containing protein n=1 Tax=Oryza meridionalis TaxID=40149 RepID=A0A0E0F0G0_9ORYZ